MPRTIMYSLREESLPEPSACQLNNFLAQLKEKLLGKRSMSYGDLEKWCKLRLIVPENEHEIFVLGYEIVINDGKPELSYFRLVIGTTYLSKIA
jgi:hypothetical protein